MESDAVSRIRSLVICAVVAGILAAGCAAPPIGAKRSTTRAVYAQMEGNALNSDQPSADTLTILHRFGLLPLPKNHAEKALEKLHSKAVETGERDLLYALAEVSFLTGEQTRKSLKVRETRDARDYYLGAAVYSYLFLFSEPTNGMPSAYDRRFRVACDLYNYGLGLALIQPKDTNAIARLESGKRRLPVGQIDLQIDVTSFPWPLTNFEKFVVADQFVIRGLSERNRDPGVGAALIGVRSERLGGAISTMTPATAFLRLQGGLNDLERGESSAKLEVHSSFDDGNVQVAGHEVPLEIDLSAHTAYALNQQMVWKIERLQFLSLKELIPSAIYLSQPYEPGLIPVVFVHGTYSSPIWWAEMLNTLRADPTLHRKYQFWYFVYNSSAPVLVSGEKLRASLDAKLKELDPEGKDPALKQIVLIGHSQGGLLSKLAVTDSGDRIWNELSDKPLDDLKLTPQQKAEVQKLVFVKPMPCVRRVVFISTPHRGSYRAKGWLRGLARRLVSAPTSLLAKMADMKGVMAQLKLPKEVRGGTITSLDGMSPKSPTLRALSQLPIAPDVKAHSIIPVIGEGAFEDGNDGVVEYKSAHIDGVESELVVRHGHSCQSTPAAIEEVRRILRVHLASQPKLAETESNGAEVFAARQQSQPGGTDERKR
jgi:pimeloyl-ACP methyl ester carboxylesterase